LGKLTLELKKITNPFENFVLDSNDNRYIARYFNDTVDLDLSVGFSNLILNHTIGGLFENINEIFLAK